MNRRNLLKTLIGLSGLSLTAVASHSAPATLQRSILIQESPLAGFRYHTGETVWSHLQEDDPLQLVREPDNRYDERAVSVYWRNFKLGYLPRDENTAIAHLLDRGETLDAYIVRLLESRNPWARVRIGVRLGGLVTSVCLQETITAQWR